MNQGLKTGLLIGALGAVATLALVFWKRSSKESESATSAGSLREDQGGQARSAVLQNPLS